MKRRSFLATFAALPLLDSMAPALPVPKIVSFKCTTNFELSQVLVEEYLKDG